MAVALKKLVFETARASGPDFVGAVAHRFEVELDQDAVTIYYRALMADEPDNPKGPIRRATVTVDELVAAAVAESSDLQRALLRLLVTKKLIPTGTVEDLAVAAAPAPGP